MQPVHWLGDGEEDGRSLLSGSGEGTFFTFARVPVLVSQTNPSPRYPYTFQNACSLSPLLPQDTALGPRGQVLLQDCREKRIS